MTMIIGPLLKRDRIREELWHWLKDGRLAVGDKLYPETQLCKQMGVSRITLRAAINDLVGQGYLARRGRLGTTVTKLPKGDKRPRALTSGKTLLFVFYSSLPQLNLETISSYYLPYKGAERFILKTDGSISIQHGEVFDRLLEKNLFSADGVLIAGTRLDERIQKLSSKNIPFVVMDYISYGMPVNAVACDDFEGGLLAARKLRLRGCKRILFVGVRYEGENFIQPGTVRRLMGLRSELSDQACVTEYYVNYSQWLAHAPQEEQKIADLLQKGKGDAIVFAMDSLYESWMRSAFRNHCLHYVVIKHRRMEGSAAQDDVVYLDLDQVGYLACQRLCDIIERKEAQPVRWMVPARDLGATQS
ncbi:MAG: GntR family transcriptional regulator [Verrucomicrobia bacterium]|nr:GntR family transcriptional regulator [Verrucomicrobiota bacterium]MBU1736366.1 GntR family transcriptional regulator [Verrucomicrobiota bacterium]MBU1858141.1 GntR family transcriptional regulator [Verrucomicrobiota bacterium]